MTDDDRRLVVIGEVNPYGSDPRMALYPLPERATGARLAALADLSAREYLRRFTRLNLCVGRWDSRAARERALAIRLEHPDAVLVLLGRRVARAFGHGAPWWSFEGRAVAVPHPSGRNRAYNAPEARARTAEALRVAHALSLHRWPEEEG